MIANVADHLNVSNIVDIGAGQGHLSRLLSFGYDFDVVSMDAEDCHTSQASKFDNKVWVISITSHLSHNFFLRPLTFALYFRQFSL